MIARRADHRLSLPRLYAILDGRAVRSAGLDLLSTAMALRDAGVLLLQYRDKAAPDAEILQNAKAIGTVFRGSGAKLLLNDYADLAAEAAWDGVHVGQTDTSVAEARRLVGPGRLVGVSTHTPEEFSRAADSDADYIAYGPIFPTASKRDAERPVGLSGLRAIRKRDTRPLVAIGGISWERMNRVFAAGADSVALIGALYQGPMSVHATASRLLERAASGG